MPFNCILDTNEACYIRWDVNGNGEGRSICFTAVDLTESCTYTIDAEVNANGTQIQCLAMGAVNTNCTESSIVNRSNIALLLIQGKHFKCVIKSTHIP